MHHPSSSPSPSSITSGGSRALIDLHKHHRGKKLEGTCVRFPREEYLEDYDDGDTENLEVLGPHNFFMHARCPGASPTACPCGRYACHIDSMIVAVDGACPGNGTDRAVRSACGVYFGPRDASDGGQQNIAFQVPDVPGHPHTSQRAELHAAIAALSEAKKFATEGGQWPCKIPEQCASPCPIKHLIIKSDSAYLVNSMTDTISKWQENGWRTSKKTPVKNRDLWEQLTGHVAEYTALGVAVDFWLVPREENAKADELANGGLDSGVMYTRNGLRLLPQH
ncbi:hypothetical protein MGN70_007681 [Eutypa lata]|nr:hypothetical protein MGN70_007681 [Eutypa lata]